ncbi:hypothetical protein I316_00541 [Kwoniella heveanensis BCC8398]|uniref:Ubiquitin-like protease family profile domain-containing protein n=1 Tax=Kwoniella heveanensis BCC8398 TaxID=1296120 RepID=A0A1B9H2C3_9TREE|nr:hypothetical protein I316_00541 [Kwoniella heveanensis BCC8398]
MEGYSVHAAPKSQRAQSPEILEVEQATRGAQQNSRLPHGKMKAAKDRLQERNVATRSKRDHTSANSMPFTPGRNTINKGGPSKQQLRDTRGPLLSALPHEPVGYQPARQATLPQPPKPRVALGPSVDRRPPSSFNIHHQPQASSSRLPSASASPPKIPSSPRIELQSDDEDCRPVDPPPDMRRTRGSPTARFNASSPSGPYPTQSQQHHRSASPIKSPSSGSRDTHAPIIRRFSPVHQASTSLSSKDKGKGKETLRQNMLYNEVHDSDSDSNAQQDDIQNPNNMFADELGEDIKVLGPDKPGSRRAHDKVVSRHAQPTDDPPLSEAVRVRRSAKDMKGKDGNVPRPPPAAAKTPARAKKNQDQMTIPSSVPNRNRSADVNRVWITPNHILKCHHVKLERDVLNLVMNSQSLAKWWSIGFEDIGQVSSAVESEQSDSSVEVRATDKPARNGVKSENRPKSKVSAKDKELEDPSQPKLNFPSREAPAQSTSARRRSDRLKGPELLIHPDLTDAEQSSKIKVISQTLAEAGADKNDLMFAYPPTGRADVNVTYGDAQRVESGDFLNDTLLEFGLRHVLRGLEEETRQSVHLFNSFFYDKLSNKAKKAKAGEDTWPAYETVKKWTKGKNIFDKKFVVVPINENYHWYLAVIVNPAGILRRQEEAFTDVDHPPDGVGLETKGTSRSRSSSVQTSPPPFKRADSDLNILDSDREDAKQDPDLSTMTEDPLDCISEQIEGDIITPVVRRLSSASSNVPEVSQGFGDLSLEEEKGQFILTTTMAAVAIQNDHLKQQPEQPARPNNAKKGKPRESDAEIWDSKGAWILTFDSLGGAHKPVANTLNAWLRYEAQDKLKITDEVEQASYWEGRVPTQDNFSDCGLYLVHYTKQLLERPEVVLRFAQIRPYTRFMDGFSAWEDQLKTAWRADETSNMREQWCDTMIGLASEFNAAREVAALDPKQRKTESDDENDAAQEGFVNGSQDDPVAALPASQFQREQQLVPGQDVTTTATEAGTDMMDVDEPARSANEEVPMPGAFPQAGESTAVPEASNRKPKSTSPVNAEQAVMDLAPTSIAPHDAADINSEIGFDPALSDQHVKEADNAMPKPTHKRFPSSDLGSPRLNDSDNEGDLVEVDENYPTAAVNDPLPSSTSPHTPRSSVNLATGTRSLSPEKHPGPSPAATARKLRGPTRLPAGTAEQPISTYEPTQFGQSLARHATASGNHGSPARKAMKLDNEEDSLAKIKEEEKQKHLAEVRHLRPRHRPILGEIRMTPDSSALATTSPPIDNSPSPIDTSQLSPPQIHRPPNSSASFSEPPRSTSSPFAMLSRSGPQASSPIKPRAGDTGQLSAPSLIFSFGQIEHPNPPTLQPVEDGATGDEAASSDSASDEIVVSEKESGFDPRILAAKRTQNHISASDALSATFMDTPKKESAKNSTYAEPIELDGLSEEEQEEIEDQAFVAIGSSPLGPNRHTPVRTETRPTSKPITYSSNSNKKRKLNHSPNGHRTTTGAQYPIFTQSAPASRTSNQPQSSATARFVDQMLQKTGLRIRKRKEGTGWASKTGDGNGSSSDDEDALPVKGKGRGKGKGADRFRSESKATTRSRRSTGGDSGRRDRLGEGSSLNTGKKRDDAIEVSD